MVLRFAVTQNSKRKKDNSDANRQQNLEDDCLVGEQISRQAPTQKSNRLDADSK